MAANITVKKYDGATDVLYTAITGASGPKAPAVWRNLTIGVAAAQRPQLTLESHPSAKGDARILSGTFAYPQLATSTVDGVTRVVNLANAKFTFAFAQDMSQTDLNEAAYQFGNLLASLVVKGAFATGVSPQ